jgi:trehalose utilization protein
MSIKALVWGENVHERESELVRSIYPEGMHTTIAGAVAADGDIEVRTAVLQDPEHGLTEAVLAETDVLLWWGHKAHRQVEDEIVERVARRVWEGMGLILLHSAHFSKIFKRLMGTPCALSWREAGERERLWEMYGEPFSVPEPLETVFISWFQGGEVFRSGLTYRRGAGNVFYFRPGHEAYPTYHDETVHKVLRNAVRWAYSPVPAYTAVHEAPNVPADKAPEPITERGPKLHRPGEAGFK